MPLKNSEKLKFSLGVLSVILLAGGVYLYKENASFGSGEATIVFDFGVGEIKEFNSDFREGENLFDFTERKLREENIDFESQEYSGLGKMVTKIGDKKNSPKEGYWQYWINGEYASVGASDYLLKPGDKIEWKFSKM